MQGGRWLWWEIRQDSVTSTVLGRYAIASKLPTDWVGGVNGGLRVRKWRLLVLEKQVAGEKL